MGGIGGTTTDDGERCAGCQYYNPLLFGFFCALLLKRLARRMGSGRAAKDTRARDKQRDTSRTKTPGRGARRGRGHRTGTSRHRASGRRRCVRVCVCSCRPVRPPDRPSEKRGFVVGPCLRGRMLAPPPSASPPRLPTTTNDQNRPNTYGQTNADCTHLCLLVAVAAGVVLVLLRQYFGARVCTSVRCGWILPRCQGDQFRHSARSDTSAPPRHMQRGAG